MFKLDRATTALSIIDVQERLARVMDSQVYQGVSENIARLAQGARILNIPLLITQQYTNGLGDTVPKIKQHVSEPHIEKITFSCCGAEEYVERLSHTKARTVIVVGMETHICVLQTVLDLLEGGYEVHVAADAVMSRSKLAWRTALDYMDKAGALITVTETVLFQLLGTADTPEFKQISQLVK